MAKKLVNLVSTIVIGSEDERRSISSIAPKIKLYEIADIDGVNLGGHYHTKNEEIFLF